MSEKILWIMAVFFVIAADASAADTADDEGGRLLQAACVQCHGLSEIAATRDGRPGWEDTVEKMVVIGAQLSPAEMDSVVDYLSRRFGPGSGEPMRTGKLPADAPYENAGQVSNEQVVLPEGPGARLVAAYCTGCHDAGRIVATRRGADAWRRYAVNMLAQGGMNITPANLESMVTYLDRHFGIAEPDRR